MTELVTFACFVLLISPAAVAAMRNTRLGYVWQSVEQKYRSQTGKLVASE